jgi:hypothetical protein
MASHDTAAVLHVSRMYHGDIMINRDQNHDNGADFWQHTPREGHVYHGITVFQIPGTHRGIPQKRDTVIHPRSNKHSRTENPIGIGKNRPRLTLCLRDTNVIQRDTRQQEDRAPP